jgi:hypothetical protein
MHYRHDDLAEEEAPMLNELLSERDLSKLSREQREFLVQRIDHMIDTDETIREILASKLQNTLGLVAPKMKVVKGVKKPT